jgi:hypothetical protein
MGENPHKGDLAEHTEISFRKVAYTMYAVTCFRESIMFMRLSKYSVDTFLWYSHLQR